MPKSLALLSIFIAAWTVGPLSLWAAAPATAPAAAEKESAACRVEAFGRVVIFDPNRKDGTRANRAQEFPAEDILLSRELTRGADGAFTVPAWPGDGTPRPEAPRCVGLEWDELRVLTEVGLEFADPSSAPPRDAVQLQYWAGESAWQGSWQTLAAKPRAANDRWTWQFGDKGQITQKVRWIFPPSTTPLALKDFAARTDSVWKTAELRVESESRPGGPTTIELYNGFFHGRPQGGTARECQLDPGKPLRVTVQYAAGGSCATDRTVLRFRGGDEPFGVAVDDVLAHDCVYLPHAGVLVARNESGLTLDAYRGQIASRGTVLEKIRRLPDQTFSQAFEKVHNPAQDASPTMLSLACDNRKFIAHENGSVTFHPYDAPDARYACTVVGPGQDPATLDACQFRPQFGDGKHDPPARRLRGRWLPIPTIVVQEGGLVYQQLTYVAPCDDDAPAGAPEWLRRRAACVVMIAVVNPESRVATANLSLAFDENARAKRPAQVEQTEWGFLVKSGPRVLAMVSHRGDGTLKATAQAGQVALAGDVPSEGSALCQIILPAWPVAPQQCGALVAQPNWGERCIDYWNGLMASAMQVELPDRPLCDLIRASQIHCMLAARNEDAGSRVVPWIASDRYEFAIDSEGHAVVRGMDMMGHQDFARRSLEFYLHRQHPDGYMTTGYVLAGTGEDLWTWAEHVDRSGGVDWARATAPKIARMCQWIIRERQKTMQRDANGRKQPWFGLAPPGVSADWNRFAYRFFNDAQYCAGLREAGRVLGELDRPEAATFAREAEQYRRDVLRAYRWCQGCSPAVPLANGTWVPDGPTILDCFGHPGLFYPGEDGRRSWCYAVELGAHHLAATGLIDPRSDEAGRMIDHLEDVAFLQSGHGDYPEERNRADVFNLGGFSKLQPYYTRIAELHAQRDDVKPFLRSYFNAIPSLAGRENLSFWEHFSNIGAWNKTHETGWFLCQTRIMLVTERGKDLWLAPFLCDQWMRDGRKVAVRNVPTRFGPTSYTIASAAGSGRIKAVIEPPRRNPPRRIVVRLRHPEGKSIRSVTVDGKPHADFDPGRECVSVAPTGRTMTIVAEY